MSKLLLALNALLVALFLFIVFKATRTSHTLNPQLLLGFLPAILAYVALARSNNRNLGAAALVVNGLLFLGGCLAAVAALLGAGAHGSVQDRLVLPALATFFLVVGFANCRAIWRRFPRVPVAKGGSNDAGV